MAIKAIFVGIDKHSPASRIGIENRKTPRERLAFRRSCNKTSTSSMRSKSPAGDRNADATQRKFPRPVTTDEVVRSNLFLHRRFFLADGLRITAARMKMTPRRRVGRVGDLTLEDDAIGAQARIRFGDR